MRASFRFFGSLQPAVTTTKFAESAQPAQPSFLELRSEVFVDAPEEVDDIWPEALFRTPVDAIETYSDAQNSYGSFNSAERVFVDTFQDADKIGPEEESSVEPSTATPPDAQNTNENDISDDISDVWPETYDVQEVENAEYHYVAENNNEWVCTICDALVSLQYGFCMECFDT